MGAPPQGVVDFIEMSDVAGDVAADVVAFLAADTTDVLAADTTDVFSAAKAADDGSCPAIGIGPTGIGAIGIGPTGIGPIGIGPIGIGSGRDKHGLRSVGSPHQNREL